MIVRRFDANRAGRDFVVGDVHGCFDQLEAWLAALEFDPECDRAFAVGDLIDRGPHSPLSLAWMARPWFHSCIGNHEELLLTSPHSRYRQMLWYANGGEWWLALNAMQRAQFTAAVRELPVAIELETRRGRIGIVHADVPAAMSWPQFVAALEAGDEQARDTALWGRDRAEGRITSPVEGIERVVCGHTINTDCRVRTVGNMWLIDTGAFTQQENSGLTVLNVDELFAAGAPGNSSA